MLQGRIITQCHAAVRAHGALCWRRRGLFLGCNPHRLPSTCPVNSRAGFYQRARILPVHRLPGARIANTGQILAVLALRCRRIDYSRALWLLMVGQPGTFLAHTGRMRAEQQTIRYQNEKRCREDHDVLPIR